REIRDVTFFSRFWRPPWLPRRAIPLASSGTSSMTVYSSTMPRRKSRLDGRILGSTKTSRVPSIGPKDGCLASTPGVYREIAANGRSVRSPFEALLAVPDDRAVHQNGRFAVTLQRPLSSHALVTAAF